MRGAYGIESRRLEQLDLALLGPIKRRRPQRTVVVMNTSTSKVDGVTVEQKSFVNRPGQGPNAEVRLDAIHNLACTENFGHGTIQCWGLRRPERRMRQRDVFRSILARASAKLQL